MRFNKKLLTLFVLILITVISGYSSLAQGATEPVKTIKSSNNQAEILMMVIALVLAFVIWGMGQVLLAMGKQSLEKNKQGKNVLTVVLFLGFTLLSQIAMAQGGNPAEVVKVVPNYGGMDSTAFYMLVTVLIIEIVAIAFLLFFIRRIQSELLPASQKNKSMALTEWWSRMDKKLFTKAVPVEKEADVLLDHDYDGIRELDNALPPWWKYGFLITIVVAFIYLWNFHVFGYGKNPTEEYQAEMVNAQKAKEAYDAQNADKVDEANLKMPSEAGLNAAKEIFASVCWTCHGKLGEGGAGPNLTDNYWIHKGSLSDIYATIKHGYPDKGMQAWDKNYSPKEINNLAGYILTLKGTNPPNQKAPQGELYVEEVVKDSTIAAPAQSGDSTISITKDSSKMNK